MSSRIPEGSPTDMNVVGGEGLGQSVATAIDPGMLRVSRYRDVDEALRTPSLLQVQHPRADALAEGTRVDFPLLGTIQAMDGPPHLHRRRAYAPLFRRAMLETYEGTHLVPALRAKLRELALEAEREHDVAVDVMPLMRAAALRVTAAIIGLDGLDDPVRQKAFQSLSERLSEGGGVYWLSGGHHGVIESARAARLEFMKELGIPSLERRRRLLQAIGSQVSESTTSDLISIILSDEAFDAEDELQVVNELTFFVVASFNTPTKLVPHVVIELNRWLIEQPESRAQLMEGEFMLAVVNEALRLHVAAPILLRRATEDVVLGSGLNIPAGTTTALELGAANRDPDVFGDAVDAFVPGRRRAGGVPAYGLAFGSGQHKCIGAPLSVAPASGHGPKATVGMIVRIMLEFMAAGMRLDPHRPSVKRTDTMRDEYATCPVIFDSLVGGA